MKNLLLVICFLTTQALTAQSDVVVIHASGRVQYFPPRQQPVQDVYPGLRLDLDGSIRCLSGSSAKLLYNGVALTVSDARRRPLRELEQIPQKDSGIGFFNRFWNFLSGSMKETESEAALEQNHRRYKESAYSGVRGFARQQYAIQSSLLYGNNLSDRPITFKWSGMEPGQELQFLLRRQSDGLALVSAVVHTCAFSIDLSQLSLVQGASYAWEVISVHDTLRSDKTEFVYNPKGAEDVLAELYPEHEYQHAHPSMQAIMEAYALESAGFYYDAERKYTDAAAAHPRNALLRDARAAFLARMDLLAEAKTIYRDR